MCQIGIFHFSINHDSLHEKSENIESVKKHILLKLKNIYQ